LTLAGIVGLVACGESERVAGSTAASETTNGFQSRVTDTLGRPVGKLRVSLAPIGAWSDSNAAISGIRTDSVGLVLMAGLDSGEYRVEVTDDTVGASFSLVVVPGGRLQFQEVRVRPLAHVKGHVQLPDGAHRAWIQALGSVGGVWTDSLGRFDLPVATGLAPIVVRAVTILDTLPLGQDTLLLAPGETKNLGLLRDPFRVAPVTFGPVPGIFENPVMASIATKTPQARIHYTLDGSLPTTASPVFSGVLDIQKSTLVRAIAVKPGLRSSPLDSAWFRIRVRPVEFHPLSGNPLNVWLASTTYGARVHCTTDGTVPTRRSPRCDTIQVVRTGWVKAIGVMDGLEDSRVDSAWFQGP
jgi:hypothetical protein